MKHSFVYLSLLFSFSLAAQNVLNNSVSFYSEESVGTQIKEVSVTVKSVGDYTYMDFKRKKEFFQINLSSLDKVKLFGGYENMKSQGILGIQKIDGSNLISPIGFSSKGEYKTSSTEEINFSIINKEGSYSMVISLPETHDTQSQNVIFKSREVTISDEHVQLFEKSLLEEATNMAIHVHK